MTRTAARQLAVQLSFAANSGGDLTTEEFFDEEYFHALPAEGALFSELPGEKEREYICAVVNGVREKAPELDAVISEYAHGWKIGRISKTALTILRCAIYEILYMPDIPPAASINEAVELDKHYADPDTVAFVNGVLGGFMRGEFPSEEKE